MAPRSSQRRPLSAVVLWAAAMLLVGAPTRASKDFDELVDLAANDAESPRGQAYAQGVREAFDDRYRGAVSRCLAQVGASVRDYRIVLRIGTTGVIEESVVSPESAASGCIEEALQQRDLPAPPFAPFFAKVEVTRPD